MMHNTNPRIPRSIFHSLPRTTVPRAVVGLCAASFLLASCGGSSDEASGGPSTTAVDPLLAGALGGRSIDDVTLEMETKVQACMTALGWEYTVVAPGTNAGGGSIFDLEADEFARQYGYGISTLSESDFAVDGAGDPNAAYVTGLSTSDQEAYYADLVGEFDATAADESTAVEMSGCYGEAETAVLGDGTMEALSAQFEEVDELSRSDARVTAAIAEWSACMAERGYSYANPEDPAAELGDRFSQLTESGASGPALTDMQADEKATALDDRECTVEAGLEEALEAAYLDAAEQVAGR